MSLAIFSMRKAYLTLKISNINFKLMNLNQQRSTIVEYGNSLAIQQNNIDGGKTIAQMQGNAQNYQLYQRAEYDMKLAQFDIKKREDSIDILRQRLETQLKMANQELQAVEKGEDAAIKRATPKYA